MNRYILHGDANLAACQDCLARVYADRERLYEVVIAEHDPKRSSEQNRLYWALLGEIAKQVPDENGKLHTPEWWAYKLRVELGYSDGTIELQAGTMRVEVPYPKSTTKMGKAEFSALYSKIEHWAAMRDVYLDAA